MAEYSNLFVVCMGMGVVFFGLICIIFLTTIMGWVMNLPALSASKTKADAALPADRSAVSADPTAVSRKVIAVIMATISRETGMNPKEIKIVSIKKIRSKN